MDRAPQRWHHTTLLPLVPRLWPPLLISSRKWCNFYHFDTGTIKRSRIKRLSFPPAQTTLTSWSPQRQHLSAEQHQSGGRWSAGTIRRCRGNRGGCSPPAWEGALHVGGNVRRLWQAIRGDRVPVDCLWLHRLVSVSASRISCASRSTATSGAADR